MELKKKKTGEMIRRHDGKNNTNVAFHITMMWNTGEIQAVVSSPLPLQDTGYTGNYQKKEYTCFLYLEVEV